ncbi:MAG: hypothetical protein P4L42_14045 [Desulfocapsaceae bacterium]|nr:hypothetical protein [Desulfocapsaceae bacterium]
MTDEQIEKLFGHVPYFADQIIEKYEIFPDYHKFVTSEYWANEGSVNVLDVCGTMHPDYAGMSWREFLSKGRRMDGNLRAFANNPSYYTDLVRRLPSIFYHKIDARTFVVEDGNHRTCIGKFYLYGLDNPYIHRVHITESTIDWRFADSYRRFLDVSPANWRAEMVKKSTHREDGEGWMRDFFALSLKVHNRDSRYDWEWSREDLERELPELEAKAKTGPESGPGIFKRLFNINFNKRTQNGN